MLSDRKMKLISCILVGFVCSVLAGQSVPPSRHGRSPLPKPAGVQMGDMKLTPEQKYAIQKGLNVGVTASVKTGKRQTRAAIKDVTKRWNNGIVPYVIDCSLKNLPTALAAINAAIAEWESKTCLRFVKRDGHKNVLTFFRNTHCWSHVGDTGSTKLSVGPGCDYQNVMVHEIGHAVGFYHEHNRPDRDTYVDVLWSNIKQGWEDAFKKVKNTDNLGFKYDYESIMHYPWNAFSGNQKNTLKPRQKTTKEPYVNLSNGDALQIAKMYNCPTQQRGRREIEAEEEDTTLNVRSRRATPCADKDAQCPAWASFCNTNDYVMKNCDLTCKKCTVAPVTQPPSKGCVDTDAGCSGWVTHCQTNDYVKKNCLKTCNRCKVVPRTQAPVTVGKKTQGPTTACVDTDAGCPAWTSHCLTNDFVKKNCKKTCNTCNVIPVTQSPRTQSPVTIGPRTQGPTTGGSCTDNASNCASLRSSCTSDNVRRKCRKTCGICETPAPCKDRDTSLCLTWKQYCNNNDGVRADCPITCNACPFAKKGTPTGTEIGVGVMCIDNDIECPNWKSIGHCTPGSYAARNCLLSCGLVKCDKKLPTPGGNCANPLGLSLANSNPLPDSAFSSSSTLIPGAWSAEARNARLYFMDNKEKKRIGAWCAKDGIQKSHIQVDLGRIKTISYIATQGRDDAFERVKKYTVSYSTNGSLFKTIQQNGKDLVFDGNCDHFTPVFNRFPSQIYARYVRVHPVESNYPCLRMELYGC